MKLPKKLRSRGKGRVLVTIYKRPDRYRLYWRARVDGKPTSRMRDFRSYADAKREGDEVVADSAKGRVNPLSSAETAKAQNALEALRQLKIDTGKDVLIQFAVSEYCEAARKLYWHGRTLGDAVDGFLSNVAAVKRVDLSTAIEQFIQSREPRTLAKDGKRPQLSPGWHYIVAMWLREFAKTLPGYAVSDLTKEHLNIYLNGYGDVSARTRNGRRNAIKMFLKWAVEQDVLRADHRLQSASCMAKEVEDFGEFKFFIPNELRAEQ